MKKILLILLLFGGASVPLIAYAQDSINRKTVDKLFELSLDKFLNVFITPSKLPQMEGNVTQKVDIIDSKEIETTVSGNRNICEAISKLPGASVTVLSRNDANWGTYGGIGPTYSTYMLQGLPIDAFMDPMSLDLYAIDHIEVQRGPASVIYPNYLSQDFGGIQSPLAGTVNLILKDKIEQPKTTFETSYGSYNTLNTQIFHQNRIGPLNYFCGGTFEMSDYTNYGNDKSWLMMNKNPEYQKTKVYGGLTLFMDKTEKQKLTIFYQETWQNGDVGRVYRGFNNQYGTLNAGYDVTFSEQFHLQSHIGLRSYNRTWEDNSVGVKDTLTDNNGVNQLIVPVDISLSWLHGKASSLSVGADYQGARYYTWTDPLVGYQIYDNKCSANQRGVYLQEEWRPMSKITLRGGLRYAFIENSVELVDGVKPAENSLSSSKLLWSAGARYSVNDNIALFANGGSSFRTPSLKSIGGTISLSELGVAGYNGQLPNPGLKPENGIGVDAGIDGKLASNFKLSIRAFYIILQDGIVDNVVSQNPSQTQSVNTAESTSKGCEIEISQKINTLVSWYANGTYIISNSKNKLDADQNNVEIPFSPNYIANIGGSLYTPFGLTFTPMLNYNGGFYDAVSKTARIFYKPRVVLNTYISQRLVKRNLNTVECFVQLYNITNNKYKMPWQFKNPGFSSMFGVKVTF